MNYKILIVDDEQLERRALESIIVLQLGTRVEIMQAVNGRDAVQMAREFRPDIAFLDIKMPIMNGIEAGKEILEFLPDCYIIMLTGFTYFTYAKESVNIGAADFLVKPAADEDVVKALEKATREVESRIRKRIDDEENRKKVQAILEMVHYQPNLMARSLASKKQYHFVAIIPSFTQGEYWEAISEGIDKVAAEMETYNITITKLFFDQYNNKTFDDITRNLLDEKVDGVLIATLFTDSVIRLSQELDRNEIPYVYVDSNIEGQHQLAYFGTESYDAGVIAARLLTDRLSPTSDILMARIVHSGKNDSNQGKNRRDGFCYYLKEVGFSGKLHEVELKISDSVYNFAKLNEIFELNPGIKGAIIFNSTCYILGNYLKTRGMQAVKLVGYDLIERNTQLLSEGVITALIAQRPERQGYEGIKSLCNYLLFKQKSEKVNLMPIDILLRENLKYYLNNKL